MLKGSEESKRESSGKIILRYANSNVTFKQTKQVVYRNFQEFLTILLE